MIWEAPHIKRYILWKLRQAQRGRVRVGPIERRAPGEAATVKVLPLRMTAAEVEALDEAWRRLGFKSRTAMVRKAIEGMLGAEKDVSAYGDALEQASTKSRRAFSEL